MNAPLDHSTVAAPRGLRRLAPALALFFLSPFVAEFLLGDFSINVFWLILFLAPMYGGGALVIRELARRLGRGWPTMLLLALAYGLLEEGILDQTLFNPHYLGFHLLAQGWMPAFGIGLWWTSFVLTLHVVWSISVPIALVEGLFPQRRTTPWLRRPGLVVSVLLLLAGCVMTRRITEKHDPFCASAAQLLAASVLIVVVVAAALRCRTNEALRAGPVPSPRLVGAAAFVLGIAFMTLNRVIHGWPLAGAQWALDALAAVLLGIGSRRAQWTARHTLAVAGGALLTYACTAFGQNPLFGGKGAVALVSHIVFAAIAVTLLVVALKARPVKGMDPASPRPGRG